jgi:hypothetical protein
MQTYPQLIAWSLIVILALDFLQPTIVAADVSRTVDTARHIGEVPRVIALTLRRRSVTARKPKTSLHGGHDCVKHREWGTYAIPHDILTRRAQLHPLRGLARCMSAALPRPLDWAQAGHRLFLLALLNPWLNLDIPLPLGSLLLDRPVAAIVMIVDVVVSRITRRLTTPVLRLELDDLPTEAAPEARLAQPVDAAPVELVFLLRGIADAVVRDEMLLEGLTAMAHLVAGLGG